jgi:indolepyruvate ferredoxin oxidoreductase
LRALKGLRGTVLEPFGHTAERRMERRLITDYRATVETVLAHLSKDNHSLAVEIASLPDRVRGFGPVKAQAVADMRAAETALMSRWPAVR